MSKTVLITGANRGIGLQVARELAGRGWHVVIGSRDAGVGRAAAEGVGHGAASLAIDVSDDGSIESAAGEFGILHQSLDVLINNAGVYPDGTTGILEVTRARLADTFHTNTFGPVRVTQAFLPYLRHAEAARVVNVSSGYGQIDGLSHEVPSYCLSKLALNGVTLMLAEALKPDGIAVNSVCPGWVRTEMGGANADRSVEEGAAGIVWLADEAPQGLTGKFLRDGDEIPW